VARPHVALMMSPVARDRLFTPASLARLSTIANLKGTGPLVEVLLTGWGCPPLDAAALGAMPELRAIVHAAGSVKGHVTAACWERGLLVSSAAEANAPPVAEYTLAMILLAGKDVFAAARDYRERRGRIDALAEYPGIGNYGKTVGVIGASKVGRRVIELLGRFDLEVLIHDPYLDGSVPLGALLAASDVVTLHAPSLPSTRHMLDARALSQMRDGAVLINTARGALVDHDALIAELRSGRMSAILDVTEPAPLPPDSPLWELPNVVLTPHVAGALGTEVRRLGDAAIDEIARYAAGEPFAHPLTAADLDRVA
jgi:phosphoglycerate dehydrogenase-like enzyme